MIMASTLYDAQSQAIRNHRNAIKGSLAHRLEVAEANNNPQLVKLLEQECLEVLGQPLQPEQQKRQHYSLLKTWRNAIAHAVQGNAKPRIYEYTCGADHWLYAVHPRTGKWLSADSEAELHALLQDN
jgi:hypothetical protein